MQAKKKKQLYRIVDRQISNLSLQQFTASARKHTEYLYPVVYKTSLQSVQAKKKNNYIESWIVKFRTLAYNNSLQVLANTPSISTQ